MSAAVPLVSVVVPTKDSVATIERCLASIRAQRYPAVELIVVDNASADGTWEVAERMADLAIRGGPERSEQRNMGVSRSRGAFVLWIDSDMELRPDVIAVAVDAAERTEATGVFIPEVSVGRGFWTRCRNLERRCYSGEPWIEAPRLVRREYLAGNGFVPWLSGTEDAELRVRMLSDGSTLAWADGTLIVHHEGRLTLGYVARKRFYYGLGLPRFKAAHPGALSRQARATVRAFARSIPTLARHPVQAAGVFVLRATEAGAYAVGAIAGRRRDGRRWVPPCDRA
jgi:glycosyltransferase involved in cell wall biosynthesis